MDAHKRLEIYQRNLTRYLAQGLDERCEVQRRMIVWAQKRVKEVEEKRK